MENKRTEYRINFKKYRIYCKKNNIPVPSWLTHIHFVEVMNLMRGNQKLHACKYLVDLSRENSETKEHGGRSVENGFMFDLKWSKQMVADIIDNFRVITPEIKEELIRPITPDNLVTADEVRDVLFPFFEIAKKVFAPRSLVRNEMTITVNSGDLHKLMTLAKKMDAPINWKY